MKAVKNSAAGTLESSDVLVTIVPADGSAVNLSVDSIVMKQYGGRIRSVAEEMIGTSGLSGASVMIQDRGALECTLRARLEAAIERTAAEE